MRLAHAHAHMRARGERDTTHTDTKAGRGQRAFNGTSGQYVYELFIMYCTKYYINGTVPNTVLYCTVLCALDVGGRV